MDIETRLRQAEALNLLTNRILMDMISLQVDAGNMTVDGAKSLIRFSTTEVIRGAAQLKSEVDFFSDVMVNRFDETVYKR